MNHSGGEAPVSADEIEAAISELGGAVSADAESIAGAMFANVRIKLALASGAYVVINL